MGSVISVAAEQRIQSDTHCFLTVTMRILILTLALVCLATSASAGLKYKRLSIEEPTLTECSMDDFLRCEREIQTALDDCSHHSSVSDILTCIRDILAMTDCVKCLCSVLPQFPGCSQYWVPSAEYFVLSAKCLVLSAECWVLSVTCWVLFTEYWVLSAEYWVLSTECWLLSAERWVLSAEYWVLSTESWVLSTECWVLSAECCISPRWGWKVSS